MPQRAIGLPDPTAYGRLSQLTPGQLVDYAVQLHDARRAGRHHDIRLGSPETGLFSWAARKGLPQPGAKHLAIRQPLHEPSYARFEGEIPSGYGAGKVTRQDLGQVLVTKVNDDSIHFTLAHRRYPERYVLMKPQKDKDDRRWLLMNVTPTRPIPYEKMHYTKVEPDRAKEIIGKLQPGTSVQAKIDGAAALTKLMKDRIDVVSYRSSALTGRPIIHTERLFGGLPKIKIPKELEGTVLRGEIYGTKDVDGGPLHPTELGGLLNAAVAKSLAAQKEKGISLHNLIFDIYRRGSALVPSATPYAARLSQIREVLSQLNLPQLHAPEVTGMADEPEAALKLFEQIQAGKHPYTTEGVVIHPPTGKPIKSKFTGEHDVYVREMFPGLGKYKDRGVGGFRYSHDPEGPIVGEVGTGLSDELREDMFRNPQEYVGRVARVRSQEKLPSGALRAPALLALHEDYPMKLASELPYRDRVEMYATRGNRILGGVYEGDRTHGVFGGGVDPGEDPAEAAAREFREEAGYDVKNPRLLAVPPFVVDWKPPYETAQQEERAKEYRGSRTLFVTGELGEKLPVGAVDPSHLQDIRLRRISEALKLMHDVEVNPRTAARAEVLRLLMSALRRPRGEKRATIEPVTASFLAGVPFGLLGAGYGARAAPPGERIEGAARGAYTGYLGGTGAGLGAHFAGTNLAPVDATLLQKIPYYALGGVLGGGAGLGLGKLISGEPHWESKRRFREELLSLLEEKSTRLKAEQLAKQEEYLDKLRALNLLLPKQADVRSPSVLQGLLYAKDQSDVRKYDLKHAKLRELIAAHPNDFFIDSEKGEIIGITHAPTGFKIHALRGSVPPIMKRLPATKVPPPLKPSEIANVGA